MTSEVVVMNRLGIALASDSAATVYVGGRAKFYHADKLFMLSNHHPVGVMVYNNSSLLSVPWETILKLFRAKLGATEFPTLEAYAEHLIAFLNGNDHLFPQPIQYRYYLQLVRNLFKGIQLGVNHVLLQRARDSVDDGPAVIKRVQSEVVKKALEDWRQKKDADANFGTGLGAELAREASAEINNLIAQYFDGAEQEIVTALYELARLVVDKEEILQESLSGLVIAGFGADQYFPVMQEYALGEVFKGKLKYRCVATERIDASTPSIIKPFAQSEMVDTFLNGISPAFELKLMQDVVKVLLESPDAIIDGMPGVGKQRKKAYKERVRPVSIEAAKSIVHRLRAHRRTKHLTPILQSIEFLPKNELAHVAASLVNLSSFQKRMSISEDETVGGPIDVAVISKGDGFVWIDRKHYFKPALNQHYFRNRALLADQERKRGGDVKEDGSGGDPSNGAQ